jgi:hypothetical protein
MQQQMTRDASSSIVVSKSSPPWLVIGVIGIAIAATAGAVFAVMGSASMANKSDRSKWAGSTCSSYDFLASTPLEIVNNPSNQQSLESSDSI